MHREIRFARGVGPARAGLLGRLGIETRGDLLLHLPRRYLDRTAVRSIASVSPGEDVTVGGEIAVTAERRTRGGRTLFQAELRDGTGSMTLTFFNPRFVRGRLTRGRRLLASGRVELHGGFGITHPDMDFLDEGDESLLDRGAVIPVYPLTAGLSQGVVRTLVASVLDSMRDEMPPLLPPTVLAGGGFSDRWTLFDRVHRPGGPGEPETARRMLALEEMYLHQLVLLGVRRLASGIPGTPVEPPPGSVETFRESLPFRLTGSQVSVLGEILGDMSGGTAMRRLLQGDVGSGKTAVAAAACWACRACGLQSAVLAPTEVLAAQHARSFEKFLGPLGARCAILTGGTPLQARRAVTEGLAAGSIDVLIGTHAILEEGIPVPGLALLVVDEQHKFGVEQRERLLSGRNPRPHMLVMSATPIPRTMAMTLYGDLDLSRIDGFPPGRGRTTTEIVGPEGRRRVFDLLLDGIGRGERAYVVYPLREASERQDARDATTAWQSLSSGPAGRFGVGLLHGSMSPAEKLAAAAGFARGETRVLVSTTVIEVGIDVPEATMMIVSHAGRFGLGQLHQLRGRIGRGGADSRCFLMVDGDEDRTAMERLEALMSTTDGFELSRRDLELRGPGELLGLRQHGIPAFRAADLSRDGDLVGEARRLALEGAGARLPEEVRWRFRGSTIPGV